MANTKTYNFKEIDFKDLKPLGFVNIDRYNQVLVKLQELFNYTLELINIRDSFSQLPSFYISKINEYERFVISMISDIESNESGQSDQIARKKDKCLNDIEENYNNAFNLDFRSRQNNLGTFIEYYTIIKTIYNSSKNIDSESLEFQKNIKDILDEAKTATETIKSDSTTSKNIINELKKKSSEQTVSDYAIVFKTEAEKYDDSSRKWLVTDILLVVFFLVSFITENLADIFPTEIIDVTTNKLLRYDFTNLITKVVIAAVQIFLISFSFKQYNVNRHLQTLNKHRQNALNSYKLFTESIIGDDSSSRNALMVQVAKSIYENSQSTGFLNEKGHNVSSGIVELTKIIGDNKPV